MLMRKYHPPPLRLFRIPKVSGTPPAAAVSAESDQYWVWAEMMRRTGCKVDHGAEQVRAKSNLLCRDARHKSSMWHWTRNTPKSTITAVPLPVMNSMC